MSSVSTILVWTGSQSRADALLAGISADDPGTFSAEVIENNGQWELKILVIGDSLRNVRSTVDDLLACLGAIESTLNAINEY
jgi:hypothetical protein